MLCKREKEELLLSERGKRMLTEDDWKRIKEKWIAEGRITDDEGYYHYTINEAKTVLEAST